MNYGKSLSEQELKSIASVLGATESILSKANLKDLMIQEKLHIVTFLCFTLTCLFLFFKLSQKESVKNSLQ